MSLSKPNASAATGTKHRVTPSPTSGLCITCIDDCPGPCEVGKSALRGKEMLYPQPAGKYTAGSEKDYPVDFSHFNIQGSCVGASGIEADSDKAFFSAVDISTEIGAGESKIKMRVPFFTTALGTTEMTRVNWEGISIATAICGSALVCGEDVCGSDPDAEFKNGKVVKSPELERRVKVYQDWYEGYGTMFVQANTDDIYFGVPEYAVEKLGVESIEIKWGQGAKSIAGAAGVPTLEEALESKRRGYIITPDPENQAVQEAYKAGGIREFDRHHRLVMAEGEAFLKEVERIRKIGAKYVALKMGAYRPADLARAVKSASEARVDLLTVDGAGGGTGMAPWRMMNEWGIPTVYIESLLLQFLKRLDEKGEFVPSCAIAGGICLEDQIFKALALGAPYIKAVGMSRSILAAATSGKTQAHLIQKKYGEGIKYGEALFQTFILAAELKEKYGADFKRIPPTAIAVYSYYDRLAVGLRQLMAGGRKFALNFLSRDDLTALTREAADISGIPYIMESDMEEVEKILG